MKQFPKTPLGVLKLTRRLWQTLADNPDWYKQRALAKLGYNPRISNRCPCCEHVLRNAGNLCDECLLNGYAWAVRCFKDPSHYRRWCSYKASLQTKSTAALEIVHACDKAIDDWKNKTHPLHPNRRNNHEGSIERRTRQSPERP